MSRRWLMVVCLLGTAAFMSCRPTVVMVQPDPNAPQVERTVVYDTVTVRHRVVVRDTVLVRDTVVVTDTLFEERTVVRLGAEARVDTVYRTRVRVDTVFRTDTVTVTRLGGTGSKGGGGGGRGEPEPRRVVVPPGHYPPAGQCRVWVEDVPPGRQARASECDAIDGVPAGAFVLYGGLAWDGDYDWAAHERRRPGSVPPAILALQQRLASGSTLGGADDRRERPGNGNAGSDGNRGKGGNAGNGGDPGKGGNGGRGGGSGGS